MSAALILLLMAVTLLVSALVSASETAVFQIEAASIRRLKAPEGVKAALAALVASRRSVLVTVLLLNLVVNLFYMNLGQAIARRGGAFLFADAAIVLGIVLLGDIVPKTAALAHPVLVASITAVPLRFLERVLAIPRAVLVAVADALMRLFGVSQGEGDLTSAELQDVLRVAAQKGELGMDEHEWLRALLDLNEVPVKEVIVPRVEMTTFDLRDGRAAFLALFVRTRHNKIPVHEGNVDRITGYLSGKDVLSWPDRPLAGLVRPVTFLPESASIADAMQQMREGKRRLAVVVDEYGGTEGIVTQEDLVEAVLGDFSDESEVRWEPVREIEPGVFEIDAALPLHALRRLFAHGAARSGIATVGGLVTATLERVPRKGDVIEVGKVRIEVKAMRGRRPDRLVIRGPRPRTGAGAP